MGKVQASAPMALISPPTIVAQISNLLYRRFPIGRRHNFHALVGYQERQQAGSTAIQQIGNLRYRGLARRAEHAR
jgi:hypothetical protein